MNNTNRDGDDNLSSVTWGVFVPKTRGIVTNVVGRFLDSHGDTDLCEIDDYVPRSIDELTLSLKSDISKDEINWDEVKLL